MLRLLLVVAMIALFTGCAQPPPKSYHAQTAKTDLGSRLDVIVNYHLDANGGIVVVDISNPRGTRYRFWLVQISTTDGQIVSASRRFHTGMEKTKQMIFKVPLPDPEITEAFHVEVFDDKGKLVMSSEPINNSPTPKGG